MNRRLAFAILAMTASQAAVYVARPITSYRLLGLGSGAQAVGFVTAAFALLPLFLAIPLGRAADRRQGPLVSVGCALQIVACLLLARAQTPATLAAASALLGLGHLGVALGVQAVIARGSSYARHDQHFGLLTAGVSLGQLVGPLLGGLVLDHRGSASLTVATGHAMLAAAALAAAATALAVVAQRAGGGAPPVLTSRAGGSVRAIVGTRGVAGGIFVSIAVLSAADVFTAYMPVLGEQRGIAPGAVGAILATRAAASMVSRLGIGAIVGLVGRVRLITISAVAAAFAFVGIAFAHDVLLLGALTAVAGFGLGFGQPLSMTIVVQLVPDHARATALAIRLTGNRIGQVAAPAAAGAIAGGAGARSVFWLLGALLVASAAAMQRSPAPRGTPPALEEPE